MSSRWLSKRRARERIGGNGRALVGVGVGFCEAQASAVPSATLGELTRNLGILLTRSLQRTHTRALTPCPS
jgi:hypothetical protein